MEFESCYVVDSCKSILRLRMALLYLKSNFGKSLGEKLVLTAVIWQSFFFCEHALFLKVWAFDLSMNHLKMDKLQNVHSLIYNPEAITLAKIKSMKSWTYEIIAFLL